MNINIVGYGVSVPYFRINPREINEVWGNIPYAAIERLGVVERAVLGSDEDAITMGLEAATRAIAMAGIDSGDVEALFFGSQTSPYLTRPSAAVLAEALGISSNAFASDVQFSGKSGTSALIMAAAMVESGIVKSAVAIGSDTLSYHVSPGDTAEYTAGSGAGAVVLCRSNGLASLCAISSCTSDTPDRFRLDGERYIRTGGAAMTNTDLGMTNHVRLAWKGLEGRSELDPASFDHLVTQGQDPRSALEVAKALGFPKKSLRYSVVSDRLGDCGAGTPLIGLAGVLDHAKPGDRIALVSYGSGAGSDAFVIESKASRSARKGIPAVDACLANKSMVSYAVYTKLERKYQTHERKVSTFD